MGEPDSTLLLSSGCGRHWPDARGIFHNDAENFFVWVNEEDQMRIVSMQKGDDVAAIFKRFADATEGIKKSARSRRKGVYAQRPSRMDSYVPLESWHGPEGRMHGQSPAFLGPGRFQSCSWQNGPTGSWIGRSRLAGNWWNFRHFKC